MATYTIRKETYLKEVRKRLTIMIPLLVLVISGVIIGNFYSDRAEFTYLAIILPLVFAYVGFMFYRGIRKQMQVALSYTLTVSDNEIIREQTSMPSITINFMEVKDIIKTKKGGFIIKGRSGSDIIYVSHLVGDLTGLEQRLQRFAPITPGGSNVIFDQYRGLLFYALGMAGLMASVAVRNNILAVLAGLAGIGFMIGLFVTTRRNKNLTDGMRRRSWIYLLFACAIAYLLYARFAVLPFER